MKIEIKSFFDGKVLFEAEAGSLKIALEGAAIALAKTIWAKGE